MSSTVVGSCNGLVCLIQLRYSFVICNPITREFVVLPKPTLCNSYGFGYLASTNEYKIVRTYDLKPDDRSVQEIEVYTLGGGNGWRNVGRLNPTFFYGGVGVLANGALHWMSLDVSSEKRMSIAFDLADEKFREIELPGISQRPIRNGNLKLVGSLGDSLMCVDWRGMRSGRSLDIWLLKENGVGDMDWEVVHKSMIWSEESDVCDMEPFAFTNSGAVLCFKHPNTNLTIYRYDFKLSSLEMLLSFDEYVIRRPSAYM